MALGGIDPLFNIYSKISDTMMYIDERYRLDFYVQLMRKGKNGNAIPFHSETEYFNKNLDQDVVSIKRVFSYGILLNCIDSFDNSVIIKPKDIPVIQWNMNNRILPWYMGEHKVFALDDENQLYMTENDQIQIPLSETSFIIFAPMIFDYADGASKEGCRLYINSFNNYINMSLDKLMEMCYYLCNTDFYNAALSMLTYVKTGPYGVNRYSVDITKEKKPSYFDKG